MQRSLDRRAVMGAAILGPIAVATCAAQPARAEAVSPKLLRLIAEYKRLDAASDEYRERVYRPIEEACDAECAQIPHHVIKGELAEGVPYTYSTANWEQVQTCKDIALREKGRPVGERLRGPIQRHSRELVVAAKWRERKINRIRARYQIDEIDDCYNAMVNEFCDAIYAIVAYPVTTLSELNLKVSIIEKEEQFDVGKTPAIIIADIRRLAAGEASI